MLEAFRLSMEKDEAIGEVFIIAGENAMTSKELLDGFSKHLNISGPVFKIPYGFGIILAIVSEGVFGLIKKEPPLSRRTLEFFNTNNAFDISKARKLLGFTPKFSFEQGLQDSKSWLMNNA